MIPAQVNKKETLFLYPRFGNQQQVDFMRYECAKVGITTYHGAYNGPDDLTDFKGVLYVPYAWSNVALFENIQRGIVHFVPTASFLRQLYNDGKPIRDLTAGIVFGPHSLCDWYSDQFKDLFVFFDSWQELKRKVETLDYAQFRAQVMRAGERLFGETLADWKKLFSEVAFLKNND